MCTSNLTESIGMIIWKIKKVFHMPPGQRLHQVLRYAACRTRTIVTDTIILFYLVVWRRWHCLFHYRRRRRTQDFVRRNCSLSHCGWLWGSCIISFCGHNFGEVGAGWWRWIQRRSCRKLNTGEQKPAVFLCVFVRFVNRKVTFPAENCSIFLTKEKSSPFLQNPTQKI